METSGICLFQVVSYPIVWRTAHLALRERVGISAYLGVSEGTLPFGGFSLFRAFNDSIAFGLGASIRIFLKTFLIFLNITHPKIAVPWGS